MPQCACVEGIRLSVCVFVCMSVCVCNVDGC